MSISALLIAPTPSPFAEALMKDVSEIEVVRHGEYPSEGHLDLIFFVIHADRGISQEEIDTYNRIRELQLPTLILVSLPHIQEAADQDQWDFDDVVMLINRVLEKVVTPYLVLHDDKGTPVGLYYLERDEVIDYSAESPQLAPADPELSEVVAEFKSEFEEEEFVIEDFLTGLRTVAIPFIPERNIGTSEIKFYITKLQQAQL
jgi:hypothetical protein